MSVDQNVTYQLDFGGGKPGRISLDRQPSHGHAVLYSIPRIARLMALAIRFERLVGEDKIRDYAELARRGHVTRARMSQIMKLVHLAPDIQEQLLFLPLIRGLNERNLRPVVRLIHWNQQRRMFQDMIQRSAPPPPDRQSKHIGRIRSRAIL